MGTCSVFPLQLRLSCFFYGRLPRSTNLHDIQHWVIPQDFVWHVHTKIQASVCVLDASGVAWPDLQPIKTHRHQAGEHLKQSCQDTCWRGLWWRCSLATCASQEWRHFLDRSGSARPASSRAFSSPLREREKEKRRKKERERERRHWKEMTTAYFV